MNTANLQVTHFTDIPIPLLFLLWRLYVELAVQLRSKPLWTSIDMSRTCSHHFLFASFSFSWYVFPFPDPPFPIFKCINYVNIGVKEVSALWCWIFRQLWAAWCVGDQTQILCKDTMCSSPLSHFSGPMGPFLNMLYYLQPAISLLYIGLVETTARKALAWCPISACGY